MSAFDQKMRERLTKGRKNSGARNVTPYSGASSSHTHDPMAQTMSSKQQRESTTHAHASASANQSRANWLNRDHTDGADTFYEVKSSFGVSQNTKANAAFRQQKHSRFSTVGGLYASKTDGADFAMDKQEKPRGALFDKSRLKAGKMQSALQRDKQRLEQQREQQRRVKEMKESQKRSLEEKQANAPAVGVARRGSALLMQGLQGISDSEPPATSVPPRPKRAPPPPPKF